MRSVLTTSRDPPLSIEVSGKSVTVSFSRMSANPFTSTLSIESTIAELNGTGIYCSTGSASEVAVIHVINNTIGRKHHFNDYVSVRS